MASVPEGYELVEESIPEGFELVEQPGLGFGGAVKGVADIAGAAVTGLASEGIKGLSAVGGLLTPGRDPQQAVASAEALQSALPEYKLGEEGQALLKTLADKFRDSPEIVQEIVNAASTLGPSLAESTFQATGSPLLASAAGAIPGALEAATGLRGARTVAGAVDIPVPSAEDVAEVFTRQSPTKQRIAKLIKEGSTDVETAGFKLVSTEGKPRITSDALQNEALKQGFDKGVVPIVARAKQVDKKKFKEMVGIMQRGKNNARYAATNRPSDVLGNSLMNRVRVIQSANKAAGKQLDSVAKELKGQSIDLAPAGNSFIDDLGDMGITIGNDLKVDFKGSDIEGLAGPESVINRVVKRMASVKSPDAFEAHRLKRFIDEQVTFGKNAEGLAGQTERALKNLRRNLDGTLDTNFPEYDRVNTAYAETIGALDALQDVAGKKMKLTGANADKATGTLMRRVLSNAQSRINLLDSVEEIERVAKKFEGFRGKLDPRLIEGPKRPSNINDDILSQVLFVDELDSVFGPVARTSFQGQIKQAVQKGATAATSPLTAGAEAVGAGVERLRGINEQGAFKAIKKLLSE